jgi:Zn-dependent protease with chaperone function
MRILLESIAYTFAAWLVTYLLHSTILLVAAWLATSRLRLSPAWRSLIWKAALVGGVATATGRFLRTDLGISRMAAGGPLGVSGAVAVVVVAVALAGGALAVWRSVGFARRRARLVGPLAASLSDDAESTELLGEICRAAKTTNVRVVRSEAVRVPAASTGGVVLVPADGLRSLTRAQRRSVLSHELGHVVHGDPHWQLITHVMEVALFLQPLNALARRRIREAAEFMADDFAVRHTGDPAALVSALTTFVHTHPGSSELAPALVSGSLFMRRAERLLSGEVSRSVPGRGARLAFAVVLAAIALGLPREAPGVDPPQDCRVTEAAAEFLPALTP